MYAPDTLRSAASATPWRADVGDGTYRNPILYADYSDPDVIRVGEDYWLTSSSFCHVPGLPILHSRDLVNWTLVNHALPRLVPEDHYATPQHGGGVWAPSLRYHAGKYWIFYPDPDFGLYAITASDPREAWSAPILVKRGKGLIDPCPIWDEDGTGYLVHGWAKSRAGVSNRITLHRLTANSLGVADEGRVIIEGAALPGWHTIEGPKLYRRNGYTYIFAPAGGVAEGYQAVFRAQNIDGPYEHRVVLAQGSTPINGPHQGAWVDTPTGEHWFFHFQEQPAYGRVVHLQPMQWGKDDWPTMGEGGEPVLTSRKPRSSSRTALLTVPPSGLALDWQWQANPRAEWLKGTTVDSIRLTCNPLAGVAPLWSASHLLMQKFPAPQFTVSVELRFAPEAEGDRAGLVVFGYDYAWLGLRRVAEGVQLVWTTCASAHQGGEERDTVVRAWPANTPVQLHVRVTAGGLCQFGVVDAAGRVEPVGIPWRARSSKWVGAKVGVFAGAVAAASTGWADFVQFLIGG